MKRIKQNRTAEQAYDAHKVMIESLLAGIQARLVEHAARKAAKPGNYGYAGDLAEVEERLQSVLDFLTPEAK